MYYYYIKPIENFYLMQRYIKKFKKTNILATFYINDVKFLKILPNKFGSFDLFFMYNANIQKIFDKNK